MVKKGQADATAIALVVIAVTLILGIFIYATIFSSINTSALDATAQTTINTVNTTAFSAFNLLAILLIVVAAAAVLAGVFLLRGRS